jgi:hypothetical protein
MIETREQLTSALTAAAELEHGLLLQYLFAAYSLEKWPSEAANITPARADRCRMWERAVLHIARDEMVHLGMVCNLLSAIGEAPQFRRPNFPRFVPLPPTPPSRPQSASASASGNAHAAPPAPPPFRFELTAYSADTLGRFSRAESPELSALLPPPPGELVPGDDPVLFDYTGQLYREIKDGFANIVVQLGEDGLFIGPRFAQDTSGWSNNFHIPNVTNGTSAAETIDMIIAQGEGTSRTDPPSHYHTFERLRRELDQGGFNPARPVASNPRVHRGIRGVEDGTTILDPMTLEIARLHNEVYQTVLLMLMQYYSFSGETPAQLDVLRDAIRTMMSMAIRPLAEILTLRPIGDGSGRTAGPCFEIVTDLRLSTQRENRWTILDERLRAHVTSTRRIGAWIEELPRLSFIADSLTGIAGNVRSAAS